MRAKKKVSLAADSVMLTFVQCVTLVTGMAQTMLLSRALTKAEYGTYSQGILVINFITPFLLLGLGNGINYFYNRESSEGAIKKYIDTIFGMVTLLGGMAGFLTLFLRKWLCAYFGNSQLEPLLILIAFRPMLKNLVSLYQPLYISNHMAKAIAIRNLVVGVAQVGAVSISLLFSKNLTLIFGLLLLLDFMQLLFFKSIFEKRAFPISFRKIDRRAASEICGYALPLAFSTMVGTLSVNMDKMLIGRMLPTEEFALYSNMAKELPFSFVVSSLTAVATPVLIRLNHSGRQEEMKRLWGRYMEAGLLATWILTAGAIACGEELVIFLYSEKYADGYWIFLVYLFVAMVRFTYFGMVLTIYGKTKQVLCFSCVSLAVNFILNYLFLSWFGIIGPALATFFSTAAMGWLQIRYSLKLMGAKFFSLVGLAGLLAFIWKLFMAFCLVLFLKAHAFHWIESNTWRLLLQYATFTGAMAFLESKKLRALFYELNDIRM